MEQVKKNILLSGVLVLSVLLIVVSSFLLAQKDTTIRINKDQFKLDPQQVITDITIKGKNFENTLSYKMGKWFINDKYTVDPQRIQVLFLMLQRLEALRPISEVEQQAINENMDNSFQVKIWNNEAVVKSFVVVGNTARTVSFFSNEKESFFVTGIPGYASYLVGIFALDAKEWRNRYVFNADWKGLKKLTTHYHKRPDDGFSIAIGKNNQYFIEELTKTDTSKMFAFMEKVSYLTVSDYLEEGEIGRYDSLMKEPSAYHIHVKDMVNQELTLEFFNRIKQEPVALVRIDSVQLALIDMAQIAPIVKSRRSTFALKE